MLINLLHQCNWFWLCYRPSQLLFIRTVWTDLLFSPPFVWQLNREGRGMEFLSAFLPLVTTSGLCMAWNKTIDLVNGTPSIECMERKGKNHQRQWGGQWSVHFSPCLQSCGHQTCLAGGGGAPVGDWWKGCKPHSSCLLGSRAEHLGNANNVYLSI